MGKKIIGLLLTVCMAFAVASCSESGAKITAGMDNSGEVAYNGGSVVATKDYVYFINGVESSSKTYKTGEVVKGALMRTKRENLVKLGDGVEYETVVSKPIISGDKDAGFYIYGEYVYYAVPSQQKDKTGNVKSGKLNFFRTRLDGTNTSSDISDGADFASDAKFRFVSNGNKVYLVVYSTSLYVYDAASCKRVYAYTDTMDSVIFGATEGEGAVPAAFFTIKPKNEALEQTASYNEVYRLTLGDTVSADKVIDGVGSKEIGTEGGEGSGFFGCTVSLVSYAGGKLYFSYTSLDYSNTYYMAVDNASLTVENNKKWTNTEKNADNVLTQRDVGATVYKNTSLYYADNCVLYTGENGLMKYDYTKGADTVDTDFGVSVLTAEDSVKSATLCYVNKEGEKDFLYYRDSSAIYYKVDLTALLAGEKAEAFRINAEALGTSWYLPEVVEVKAEGKSSFVFVGVYDKTDYYSYNYTVNTTAKAETYAALKTAYDAETDEDKKAEIKKSIDDFYSTEAKTREKTEAEYKATLLGVMSSADKTSYEAYIKNLKAEA